MNAVTPRHPALELLGRYRAVLSAAWAARHELAGPRRLADETAFLPAALSLQETPVHPAPRRVMAVLMALFTLALGWSIFGRVDIVAVAPGRVVVSEGTKLVQPLEPAVVKAIHVQDGDRVKAGQLLVELDATAASADARAIQDQGRVAEGEAQRSRALLAALRGGGTPSLRQADAGTQALLSAEWSDIAAKQARLDAEAQRRQAELATHREQLARLQATLPLARQREADFLALQQQGFMSSHAGQDRTRERIELERDAATQQARVREAEAALHEGQQARAAWRAETERALADRLAQAELKRSQLGHEGAKSERREHLTRLTAPVDGTVQQLAVHTPGGVVTAAQPLMVIVPSAAAVTAEVVIDNKDIGFVREGQTAAVKLDTFNFTRYGSVPARVAHVSADAVPDEQRGAVFKATLVLERDAIDVDGRRIRIAPGMNLSAEVATGQRRVIEFLLSPLQKHVDESLKER